MDKHEPTLDRFMRDVGQHKMEIIRDDGVHRHLRFRAPGCSAYWFDILTWPGALCIDGDCGSHVFRRLTDMFEFFRATPRDGEEPGTYINAGYWSEKVVSGGKGYDKGLEEFVPEIFRSEIVRQYRDYFRDSGQFTEAKEGFQQLREEVLGMADDGEHVAMSAAYHFQIENTRHRPFEDISTSAFKQYTWHFIWCLRAIAWAIHQYDSRPAEA